MIGSKSAPGSARTSKKPTKRAPAESVVKTGVAVRMTGRVRPSGMPLLSTTPSAYGGAVTVSPWLRRASISALYTRVVVPIRVGSLEVRIRASGEMKAKFS